MVDVCEHVGFLRVVGRGRPLLCSDDLTIEFCQRDGSWFPLRGVTSLSIKLRPNQLVNARIEVELTVLDIVADRVALKLLEAEP
jgi:hypothetical protein